MTVREPSGTKVPPANQGQTPNQRRQAPQARNRLTLLMEENSDLLSLLLSTVETPPTDQSFRATPLTEQQAAPAPSPFVPPQKPLPKPPTPLAAPSAQPPKPSRAPRKLPPTPSAQPPKASRPPQKPPPPPPSGATTATIQESPREKEREGASVEKDQAEAAKVQVSPRTSVGEVDDVSEKEKQHLKEFGKKVEAAEAYLTNLNSFGANVLKKEDLLHTLTQLDQVRRFAESLIPFAETSPVQFDKIQAKLTLIESTLKNMESASVFSDQKDQLKVYGKAIESIRSRIAKSPQMEGYRLQQSLLSIESCASQKLNNFVAKGKRLKPEDNREAFINAFIQKKASELVQVLHNSPLSKQQKLGIQILKMFLEGLMVEGMIQKYKQHADNFKYENDLNKIKLMLDHKWEIVCHDLADPEKTKSAGSKLDELRKTLLTGIIIPLIDQT